MEQKMEITEKLNQAVEKIVREYQPEKIILFGSYAWGKPTEDSDVDLFIVKESGKRRIDRAREVREIIWGIKIPFDILVYTPAEVEKKIKEDRNLFIEDIEPILKIHSGAADCNFGLRRFVSGSEYHGYSSSSDSRLATKLQPSARKRFLRWVLVKNGKVVYGRT